MKAGKYATIFLALTFAPREFVADFEAALEQFREIANDLAISDLENGKS